MNKIIRQLMSGASLAVLSLGVPSFAVRATAQPTGPASFVRYFEDQILVAAVADFSDELMSSGVTDPASLPYVPTAATIADSSSGGASASAEAFYVQAPNILNLGPIAAYATAHNALYADARAAGVRQLSFFTTSAENVVDNRNAIEGYAFAYYASTAEARAAGVFQGAMFATFVTNEVDNYGGLIGGSANAYSAGYALASGVGVYQTGNGLFVDNTVNNYITDEFGFGTILGYAKATAYLPGDPGAFGTAYARAVGVYQGTGDLLGPPPGATFIDNLVYNEGLIAAVATATYADVARAEAFGIYQDPPAITAHNYVTNYGTIEAFANASYAYSAVAHAVGVDQDASATYIGDNNVDNFGLIGAAAVAQYATYASATATGVRQDAYAFTGQDFVANDGTIIALADASALFDASARAAGVYQMAQGVVAYNSVDNAGTIAAFGRALGGTSAYARANGVYQRAYGFISADNYVNNDVGGLIAAGALAIGGPRASSATAIAAAVGQSVYATTGPLAMDADNSVENYGIIAAGAMASYADYAQARAWGAYQYAAASTADNYVLNSTTGVTETYGFPTGGLIIAVADAADARTAEAQAAGVYQQAYASYAHNQVDNYGAIIGIAAASDARTAEAGAAGVYQIASYASMAYNTVNNYGLIVGAAFASDARTADASAAGIYQNVSNSLYGRNYVDNDEDGAVMAFAAAEDARTASAQAAGVYQFITDDYIAYNTVDNDGLIMGAAYAAHARTANASAAGVLQEAVSATYIDNNVNNYGAIMAFAMAESAGEANAKALGVAQSATYHDYFTADNYVYNEGLIAADAFAANADTAKATAIGVYQGAGAALATYVHNSVVNYGTIAANAEASYASYATAKATGVHQYANGFEAYNSVNNECCTVATPLGGTASASGLIKATALAHGTYTVGTTTTVYNYLTAGHATALGVYQEAHSSISPSAYNYVYNDGVIAANAEAWLADYAYAKAVGVDQNAFGGDASNRVYNDWVITADAFAHDATSADATAIGVDQYANGLTAYNYATNHWSIRANANASDALGANAEATGIHQHAVGSSEYNYVGNYGFIGAYASAYDAMGAGATAVGVNQEGSDNRVHNSGTISAAATAWYAFGAGAQAAGVYQYAVAPYVYNYVTNDGIISAFASASSAFLAQAEAGGIVQYDHAITAYPNIQNNGYIGASAIAQYASSATAAAVGIGVANMGTGSAAGVVAGRIVNDESGVIVAEASAYGFSEDAWAVGIGVEAAGFAGTITNIGQIDAQAFGSYAQATGIGVEFNGNPIPLATVTGLIVNDGGFIFASENYSIGNAINVQEAALGHFTGAPNEVDIILEGSGGRMGELFGNILNSATSWTNTITVRNGVTYLDGSINPGLVTLANGGTLSILGGGSAGTLWLPNASTSFWGANPVVNVAAYSQAGTLKLDIDGFGNVANINAVTASLGGTVLVNPNPYTLFDTMTFDVVDGGISGTWSVQTTSVSPLLTFAAQYTGSAANIVLTRTAFGALAGLTPNEAAVGDGLEGGYSAVLAAQSLSSPTAAQQFYESIFLFDDTEYPQALNMLSGTQAGEVAQANVVSVGTFVDKVSGRLDAMSAALGAGAQFGSAPIGNGITLWGVPYTSWTNTTSSASGPGYVSNPSGIVVGGDMLLDGTRAIVGLAVSVESKSYMHFKNGSWNSLTDGGVGTSKGWNIGAYARYNAPDENGGFYLQGSASYGNYDNATRRYVEMPYLPELQSMPTAESPPKDELPPFDNTPELATGWLAGAFTSDLWSIYAEGGIPVVTGNVTLTPFVGIRYVNSDAGAYDETGSIANSGIGVNTTVPALHVSDVSATSISSYLGAQLTTELPVNSEVLLPSLRVAWAHDFEDSPWKVDAWFSGIGSSSAFSVDGSAWSQDSAVIDAQLSMVIENNMLATIGYQAHTNGDQTNQSLFGRFDIRF